MRDSLDVTTSSSRAQLESQKGDETDLQMDAKLAMLVNIHRVIISCIPLDTTCISVDRNKFHYFPFPTSQPLSLQSCKTV